jgi:glutaredoxin 3
LSDLVLVRVRLMQQLPCRYGISLRLAKRPNKAYLVWYLCPFKRITMAAPKIEIYTKFGCPFCIRAKRLLDQKGVTYREHDITLGGPKREEMLARAPHATTVPQIFIGDIHVGGSDDLAAFEASGKLDALLAGVGQAA